MTGMAGRAGSWFHDRSDESRWLDLGYAGAIRLAITDIAIHNPQRLRLAPNATIEEGSCVSTGPLPDGD